MRAWSIVAVRHGAVRALATTAMVVATAIGPGLTGLLIDADIDFPSQGMAMGFWCLALSAGAVVIAARLGAVLRPGAARAQ